MVNYSLIKKLNSKNVSLNTDVTKKRVREIWRNITKEQRDEAINVGGFSNSRSFNKTRKTGIISVRMTLAISIAVKVNPFYITAEENDKKDYSEEKIILFIKSKNMNPELEVTEESILKNNLKGMFSEVIENLSEETLEYVEKLEKEELITLLDSLFIKEKLGKKKEKLLLIKILLTQ
ncbi:MAG: hypothetical protein ACRC30_16070 [Clostridium sp.]